MEETVEATTTVIQFLGAAVVEDKCVKLLTKARDAEEAVDAAGVDRADLTRAIGELEQAAREEGRLLAIVKLRDASTALEGALERSCGEYHAAAEGMKKVLRAKEDAGGRRAGSWWSELWRRSRRQHGLHANLLVVDVEAGDLPKETLDDVHLTVNILSDKGLQQLEAAGGKLVVRAPDVIAAADAVLVPRGDLSQAANALEQARDPAARLNCVINLGRAATAVEGADSAPLKAVRDLAADLTRACRELKEAAEAMARVQRAAAELRERRGYGAWWSRLFGRPRRCVEQVLEDGAAAAVAVQPGLGQREEKASDMTGFALCGLLAFTQHLGPDTVAERVKLLPKEFRCWFHAGLCLWWILQSAGMTCSTYAQHLKELQCVRILGRLGILALNCFFIVFAYLALGIHNKPLLIFWLVCALLVHLGSFALACCRGALSK